jgi:hypothetical protein
MPFVRKGEQRQYSKQIENKGERQEGSNPGGDI